MNPLKLTRSLLTIAGTGILSLANRLYQSPEEIEAKRLEIRANREAMRVQKWSEIRATSA